VKRSSGVPAQARNRFGRALYRALVETAWLRYEQTALRALGGKDHFGVDFFIVAHTAIAGDRLIRLVRLLEDDSRVASFWYLHRCAPKAVEGALAACGMSIDAVRDLARRIKLIRDKAFVHVDKTAVFNPEVIYRQANVNGPHIQAVIEAIWSALNSLHRASGKTFASDEYNGADISKLHALYIASGHEKD
jgi:hypothetical protein